MQCDDGLEYVLKGSHNGRTLIAEHVVARLGQLISAPVGHVSFAVIAPELKAAEPQLADVGTGICHATEWVPDCTDAMGIDHMDKSYNRDRFALLQVLYSWAHAENQQLIYAKIDPHLVHSVDHGHFLTGSTGWTAPVLKQIGNVVLDPFFTPCGLPQSAMAAAKQNLSQVTDDDIRMVTQGPPDEWGVQPGDREALAEYFTVRRDRVLALLPS
jgi:hypothetical protein